MPGRASAGRRRDRSLAGRSGRSLLRGCGGQGGRLPEFSPDVQAGNITPPGRRRVDYRVVDVANRRTACPSAPTVKISGYILS